MEFISQLFLHSWNCALISPDVLSLNRCDVNVILFYEGKEVQFSVSAGRVSVCWVENVIKQEVSSINKTEKDKKMIGLLTSVD